MSTVLFSECKLGYRSIPKITSIPLTTIMTYVLSIGTLGLLIDGGFVMNQNDALSIYAKTAAEVVCGVRFYFHSEED